MPSSSRSAGFSSRGLISTKFGIQRLLLARGGTPRSISFAGAETGSEERSRQMAYTVPDLPYAFDALEAAIDAQTMEIHHDKHHAAYVANLNAALEGTEWADRPLDNVIENLESIPEDKRAAVRNNGGGHWNHTFFWQIMKPG